MSLPQESLVTSSQDTFGLPGENKPISDVSELVKFLKTNASAQRKKGGKAPVGLIDEEKVVSEGKQQFPWMTRFSHLCREAVGSQSIKTLENLISVYIRNVTEDVKQCYKKPKRAGKLKTKMNDALKLFHMLYSGIKKPLEHTFYLDKMSDLMAMCIDMELKASRRGRENLKKISRRLTSSLFIFLDNSTDHILDAILRSKFFTKSYSEICVPVLIRILRDSPGRQVYEMTYVRYLLAFKLWKRFVDKKEERVHINKMAASKLTPPTGFLDKLRSGMFNGILPYVSKSEKERITLFLMRAPFNVKEKAEAFQKISRDPKDGMLVVHPGADLDKSLFFSEELKFSSESDNKMDCGSIMLINDIWSSMTNTEAGPTDCLKLNNLCSDKTLLETKKKKNKSKIKHLPKEKSNKTNNKDKNISSYVKEKKRKKCKDKSLKLNLLEDRLRTKSKLSETSFLDKLKGCKSNSISLLLTGKQVDEKEKNVLCDFRETCATVKSEDVCDETVVEDNKNRKDITDGVSQTDIPVESTCKDDSCISSTDSKDKVNVCTEEMSFKENSKHVNIKVTAVIRNVNENTTGDKHSSKNSSELTVESGVIKTESVDNDTNIVEVIINNDKGEVANSTNINERVIEAALDVSKVACEVETGTESQEINQEVCIVEENRDNESLDCLLVKDSSSASPNTLSIPCQESFISSKEGHNEIHTSFPRDIFFGDNFFTIPPSFPEGNEDIVSQLFSEWPSQPVGFELPKEHDNYLPAVLLRNDIAFGGLFPEATIDNDEVSDEDINNCYHGQSQYSKGAKVAFGEMATGSNLEDTEAEWAEQDFESASPVSRSDSNRIVMQPSPIPVISESSPAPVPVAQKQYDGKMSQSVALLDAGCKKNEKPSKNVSEEAHSAYNSMSQCRQIPPTSVCQTSVTASTPVPKSNKEKSIIKGMLTRESLSLHDRTVYRDHMHYITQKKFRIFYLSKDAPADTPIPYPTEISPHTYQPVMRCPCSLCYANHMALIANYNSLTQYRNVRLRNDAEMRKSQNEELLRRIEESLNDAKQPSVAEPSVAESSVAEPSVSQPSVAEDKNVVTESKTSNDIDTSLPIKKRKTFIQMPHKPDSDGSVPSYPCTPMISIAQVDINGAPDKQDTSNSVVAVPSKKEKLRFTYKVPKSPSVINSANEILSNQSEEIKTAAQQKGNCLALDDDQSVTTAAQNLISLAHNSRKRNCIRAEKEIIKEACVESSTDNVRKSHRHHHRSKRSKQDKQERRERRKQRKLENT